MQRIASHGKNAYRPTSNVRCKNGRGEEGMGKGRVEEGGGWKNGDREGPVKSVKPMGLQGS